MSARDDKQRDLGPGTHAEAGSAGEARKAAETTPRADTDRWTHFSQDDVDADADDPARPEGSEKPLAGLARDGGVVEGESEDPPS